MPNFVFVISVYISQTDSTCCESEKKKKCDAHVIVYANNRNTQKKHLCSHLFLFYSHQMSRYIILEKKLIFAKKL